MGIFSACTVNIYYLGLYNFSTLQGDIFVLGILFSVSEVIGIIFGQTLVAKIPDNVGAVIGLSLVLVSSNMLKMSSEHHIVYILFIVQVFSIGICYNVQVAIGGTRVD
jgi:hypothetical protein